jgi:SAM-dependent methyltransferase
MSDKTSRLHKIRNHYLPRLASKQEHHEMLDWAARETQHRRFDVLRRAVDLDGKGLLDVGCGLGDLLAYLKERQVHVTYTGVDIMDEMIERAGRLHPESEFIRDDIFLDRHALEGRTFDVVYCSGALNLNLENNMAFLADALPTLVKLADEKLVVNFLHVRATISDPTYYHYDPDAVIPLLTPLARDVRLIDDYLENDFTLVATPA